MEMIWIWLAVVAVSLIIEFITMDLTSVWFSVAGLVSLVLSAIGGVSWEVQLIVFIVLSALLLIFVRGITKKFLLRNQEDIKTNIDSLIGKRTKLLSPITQDKKGTVSINGVTWTAATADETTIDEGKVVEIIEVSGNKLIVRKIKGALEQETETQEQKSQEQSTETTETKNEN